MFNQLILHLFWPSNKLHDLSFLINNFDWIRGIIKNLSLICQLWRDIKTFNHV